MKITLTPDLENYVKAKVERGLYNSATEVIQESLRALQEKDIDAKIKIGLEQAEAGMSVPMDQKLIDDLEQKLTERINTRAKKA